MLTGLLHRVLLFVLASLCAVSLVLLCACRDGAGAPESGAEQVAKKVRVVVVELHGFVGCGVDADLLRSPLAEVLASVHEAPDAVVFSIDSGGGMLNRVGPMSDVLHRAFGDEAPVALGWVVRAESAAAMIALGLPELWMPPDGVIGGAVGVERGEGGWQALPEPEQQAIRYMVAACAARGGHDRSLALSLVASPASDESTGDSGLVMTGRVAQEKGLAQTALTIEDMLDARFGAGGWEILEAPSVRLSEAVQRAEAIREQFSEVCRRFEIAIERGEASPGLGAIEAAELYLDQALEISTSDDDASLRAMAFVEGFAWVSWAIDEMERVSGEDEG